MGFIGLLKLGLPEETARRIFSHEERGVLMHYYNSPFNGDAREVVGLLTNNVSTPNKIDPDISMAKV